MGPAVTSDTVEGLGAPLTAEIVAVSSAALVPVLPVIPGLLFVSVIQQVVPDFSFSTTRCRTSVRTRWRTSCARWGRTSQVLPCFSCATALYSVCPQLQTGHCNPAHNASACPCRRAGSRVWAHLRVRGVWLVLFRGTCTLRRPLYECSATVMWTAMRH